MSRIYRHVSQFRPPDWARRLPAECIPQTVVTLAQVPTPIHEWSRFPGIPPGFSLGIKRDDLTHSTMTGNKIRKLEFLMADAIRQDCGIVITSGSLQTNHGRATAAAAKELGLDPYLVLRARPADVEMMEHKPSAGNFFLDKVIGAGIVLAPYGPQEEFLMPRMRKLAEDLLASTGKKSYLIPVGGSNLIGMWGYITAFQEMMDQGLLDNYDDIVLATGSGGSCCGLSVANYLLGSPLKIHGITVCDEADDFYDHIDDCLTQLKLNTDVSARDIVDIVDGYKGAGYGIASDEIKDFLLSVSCNTGIILDPVYTGKAAFGLRDLMHNQPKRFKGQRVLFLHTGGLLGTYGVSMDDRLLETSPGQVVDWTKELQPLPLLPHVQ